MIIYFYLKNVNNGTFPRILPDTKKIVSKYVQF